MTLSDMEVAVSPPALGESANHLPWLSPCAATLVALTRVPTAALWSEVRTDPGCVLLLLRQGNTAAPPPTGISSVAAWLREPELLEDAARLLDQATAGFVDWTRAELWPVRQASLVYAHLASQIASRNERCCPDRAWMAGLLAPLGWLAACAVDPAPVLACLREPLPPGRMGPTQQRLWGLDQTALARRLAQRWRLPAWLTAVVGQLPLPLDLARTLGVEPALFQTVQLAVALAQQQGAVLQLPVGTRAEELCQALGVDAGERETLRQTVVEFFKQTPVPSAWRDPRALELLPQLLRLAADQRRLSALPVLDRLQEEVDLLHHALQVQRLGEAQRLHERKLDALGELAAGAGHEINNPLAVISGQAQYLLNHETDPTRCRPLQTIIGQAQRIHLTLTDLMQFARPPVPHPQPVEVGDLMRTAAAGLELLAEQRQVRLVIALPTTVLALQADAAQVKTALTCLLRNAIEAAPAEGWAAVRVEIVDEQTLEIVVEDNGPGPNALDREHLFDPFYSGRKAGRGRGLGLPTAWRLARQHGGDVSFAATEAGPTRFALRWPRAAWVANPVSMPEPAPALIEPGLNGVNGCHVSA